MRKFKGLIVKLNKNLNPQKKTLVEVKKYFMVLMDRKSNFSTSNGKDFSKLGDV